MNITIHSGNWEELQVDALAVLAAKGASVTPELDARLSGLLSELAGSGEFAAKPGECDLAGVDFPQSAYQLRPNGVTRWLSGD